MREERHLEQQSLAIVAHDVAAPDCQLWRQQLRADPDLPEGVKRPVDQCETDAGLRTDCVKSWKSCKHKPGCSPQMQTVTKIP